MPRIVYQATTQAGLKLQKAYGEALFATNQRKVTQSALFAEIQAKQRATPLVTSQPAARTRDVWGTTTTLAPAVIATPATTALEQSTPAQPMSLAQIIGAVGNAVGDILAPTPTATVPTPTSPVNTFGNVVSGALSVLPGVGTVASGLLNAVGAGSLPGRANTPVAGGMSEFILERPTGSGGTGMSGLARYGIPRGWTRKKVKALVRTVGVAQAAAILGAPLEGVAIVACSPGRRGRGISSRDLRITRRVTRRVLGIARDLAAIRPPAARRAPSRGTRVICN